jgi:metal-responsive CopG/Arc/MetJ family transcriptional regulator
MAKEKFGITVDKANADTLKPIIKDCKQLDASRSEIIDAILTAFLQSDRDHTRTIREVLLTSDDADETTSFGVSVDQQTVDALEPITKSCEGLDATRSDVVDAILSKFFAVDRDHAAVVQQIIGKKRTGEM